MIEQIQRGKREVALEGENMGKEKVNERGAESGGKREGVIKGMGVLPLKWRQHKPRRMSRGIASEK